MPPAAFRSYGNTIASGAKTPAANAEGRACWASRFRKATCGPLNEVRRGQYTEAPRGSRAEGAKKASSVPSALRQVPRDTCLSAALAFFSGQGLCGRCTADKKPGGTSDGAWNVVFRFTKARQLQKRRKRFALERGARIWWYSSGPGETSQEQNLGDWEVRTSPPGHSLYIYVCVCVCVYSLYMCVCRVYICVYVCVWTSAPGHSVCMCVWTSPPACVCVCVCLSAPGLNCSTQDLHCSLWNLVPWPGIEPGPSALAVRSLSHWTTREVTGYSFESRH